MRTERVRKGCVHVAEDVLVVDVEIGRCTCWGACEPDVQVACVGSIQSCPGTCCRRCEPACHCILGSDGQVLLQDKVQMVVV